MPGRPPHWLHHRTVMVLQRLAARREESFRSSAAGAIVSPARLAPSGSAGCRPPAVQTSARSLAPRPKRRRAGRGCHGAALARLAVRARRILAAPRATLRRGPLGVALPVGVRIGSGVDQSKLRDWAWARSGWQFEMQAYADMRREPRWDYRFGAPTQVKADCVGRIVLAADEWRSAVSGHPQLNDAIQRLPECLQDPERMFFVGPLEGSAVARTGPKSSMSDEIEEQLRAERVTPLSFVSLVNAVLFFQVNAKLLGLAVDAMARTRYRLRDVETRKQLFSVFRGLAVAAAICRNRTLADSVRKAVRRYRKDLQWRLPAGEALEILMIAAASHEDLEGWMNFVGDVFTDIAFEDLQEGEKNVVAVFIQSACEITPQLWTRCGRADAAVAGCRGAITG